MPNQRTSTKLSKNTQKKPVRRKLSKNQLILYLFIAIPALIIAVWASVYYGNQYAVGQADKAKFAKVEVLVNNVKTDLETAFPEKKWGIVKFCDPLKGEFGNIIEITCGYGVKADDVVAKDIQPIIEKYAKAKRAGETTHDANTYDGVVGSACLSASSYLIGGTSVRANFYCLATTISFIYPEHHYPQ